MDQSYPDRSAAAGWTAPEAFDAGLRRHMVAVYNRMVLGLALTGVVAYLVAVTPTLYHLIFGTSLAWVVLLVPVGFVFFLSLRARDISALTAQALFWTFCAVMGLSLASIFLAFTGASIARVFFISAATFGGASLFGYTTGADLNRFGSFLVMGLIGIVIAGLVNLLLASSALQFATSVIGVVVFTGLAAYDTQAIRQAYIENAGTEANEKLAMMGALSLYLSFLNLFLALLQLLGGQRED
jgi:FtsH-binding integral membrane protein